MDKVKLPREVSEAIEGLRKDGFRAYHIVCMIHESRSYDDRVGVLRKYVIDNDDNVMQALVNGYEVEQTKEDKVREVISSFCNGAIVSDWVIEDIKKIYEGDAQ